MCETCHVSHYRYHRERQAPGIPFLRRARPAAPGPARRARRRPRSANRQEADCQAAGTLREPSAADKQVCPVCQITFLEFRNSGRLGCPYDYEVFRDELMPLLENIHDETRHSGKVPKRARGTPSSRRPDPASQRAEAGRGRRGLRDGRAAARQDQVDRAGAGPVRLRSASSRGISRLRRPGHACHDVPAMPERGVGPSDRDGRRQAAGTASLLACAKKAGLALPESPPNLALDAVVQSLIVAHVGELVGELAELTCPDCGIKFMEFRARGPARLPAGLPGLRARACSP